MTFEPTEQQTRIIGHDGSAFVAACPGSGKTAVLVERARHMLREPVIHQGVAFLSFTNAAISELETRLREEGLIGPKCFPHFIGTFDSFLWQFIVQPLGLDGSEARPRLVPDKSERLVRPNPGMRELPLRCFDDDTGNIIAAAAAGQGFNPAANPALTRRYEDAARAMRARFVGRGELDFSEARRIANQRIADAATSRKLAAALSARFREIVVDEAQDCNPADLQVVSWLKDAGIRTKVICDPEQSIYSFRGGVTEELRRFGEGFGADNQLPISGNFRSTDHICKAVAGLRALATRGEPDEALGKFKDGPLAVHILSYGGRGVSPAIGPRFSELARENGFKLTDCPVLAATRKSSAKAAGQPFDDESSELSVRLACAVTEFAYGATSRTRITALEDVHRIVLSLKGELGPKTYHQHLSENEITPDGWRPHVLGLVRALQFDPARFADADAWLAEARRVLGPLLPPGGSTIAQRLRNNNAISDALGVPAAATPRPRTIHSVKGMEFPAVCVVMSPASAKRIVDYLAAGAPEEAAEEARKIYVAATRARQLLVLACPQSQCQRLTDHLAGFGGLIHREAI